MAFEFRFPDVGEGIAEGEIVKWLIKEGDTVANDQKIVEIETDKAIVSIPSPKTGTILKRYGKEGDVIKVGSVLVVIGKKGEKHVPIISPQSKPQQGGKGKSVSVMGILEEAGERNIQKVQLNLKKPLEKITVPRFGSPTTPSGQASQQSSGSNVEITKKYDMWGFVERIPYKGIRKAVGEHMKLALQHATLAGHFDEVDATELAQLREKEKITAEKKGIKLTFLPFVVKAVCQTLKEFPKFNASLEEETNSIVIKKYYNLSIAVDTPEGLMTPVVKRADTKTIFELAQEMEKLSAAARERTIDLMDIKGGTFTITNAGSIGGQYIFPILNYPDVAILALGRLYDKAVVKDGKIVARKVMPLSLIYDHRVIDGADAARFINKLKEFLEHPAKILVEK